MTVSVTNSFSGPMFGNGSTTVFPFSFSTGSADEVSVLVNGALQVAGYTVSLTPIAGGGSVTFSSPPANGAVVVIASNPAFTQETQFEDAGQFLPSTHDSALDEAARRDIYLNGKIVRAPLAPIGETMAELPSAASRAGKFLAFDGSGNPIAAAGGGGDSGLRTDLAASTGASLLGWIQAGVGAVIRSIRDKLRESPITPKDFGAVADGATDDHTALQAWLDVGGRLSLPFGCHYSSDNLILRKSATIDGVCYGFDARIVDGSATVGYENQPGSRIHFAAGKGFKVEPQTTVTDVATAVAAGVGGYTQEGAFNSVIRNIALIGAGTGATTAGFYSRTLVHLHNVHCLKFTGKGFDISASAHAPDGNSEYGNASLCTLTNCQAISNGSHGLHLRGADVNGCTVKNFTAQLNGGWGYLDESSLGNNYVGGQAATNTLGSYKCIGSVANSTYTGCYVESGTGQAPDLSYRCVVSGGYLADYVQQFNVGTNGNPTILGEFGVETNQCNLRTATSESTTVASGHALIYRGANRGLCLMGAPDGGGSYDVTIANKNAGVVWRVPTGTADVNFFGAITSAGATSGIGYASGAGGTVTQATSKATGVTLNKTCGAVTLNNAALAAGAVVSFTLTDSAIAADDFVDVWVKSGYATAGTYRCWSEGSATGARAICLQNISGGSLSEAVVLGFGINKRSIS